MDGEKFDSKSEYTYYVKLKELESQGYIKEIERQYPRFKYPQVETASDRCGWYTPDFYVIDWKDRIHYVEFKGKLEADARIKMGFVEYLIKTGYYEGDPNMAFLKRDDRFKVIPQRNSKETKKWKYNAMDTSYITEDK